MKYLLQRFLKDNKNPEENKFKKKLRMYLQNVEKM